MKVLIIVILAILLTASVVCNINLYLEYAPRFNTSEFKEKRFLEKHKDAISMLLFKSGSVERGIIRDETPEIVSMEIPNGFVDYKKSDIRKIIYNVERKKEK